MLKIISDEVYAFDWYILLCKPNQNHIAARHLTPLPLNIFMPYHMASVRQGGRFLVKRRPLFAGYIFIGGEPDCVPWRRIRTTPGVSQVIGSSARGPSKVPGHVVAGLLHRCDAQGLLQSESDLAAGDKIKIISGPFAEFVSTIEHIDSDERIHALLNLLGAQRRIEVDTRHVTRLG